MQGDGIGYVRIAAFGRRTAEQLRSQIASLTKSGATKLIVDVRNAAAGDLAEGIAAARLFVASGTIAVRESRVGGQAKIAAAKGDGAITAAGHAAGGLRHVRRRRDLRGGAVRQQARGADRRADDRPHRRAGTGEASRWQRALDYLVAGTSRRLALRFRPKAWNRTSRSISPKATSAPAPADAILQRADRTAHRQESGIGSICYNFPF